MKRREFINWVGVGLISSFFPVALAACSGNEATKSEADPKQTPTTQDTNGTADFISVGTTQELASQGYLVDRKSKVIVVRDDVGEISALSLLCTHLDCALSWQQKSNNLYCDCHGSEFATDGKVLKGPANSPLANFEVKEENESILVRTS